MPSFDITSEVSKVELHNSIDLANKEIRNRFDFKGSDSRLEQTDLTLTMFADDDFKLKQVYDILVGKLTKRSVDTRFLTRGTPTQISGNKLKEEMEIKNGIEKDLAKKIIKLLKDKKLKVKASIQQDSVRVIGSKRDVLQEAIQIIKEIKDQPLHFGNFRD